MKKMTLTLLLLSISFFSFNYAETERERSQQSIEDTENAIYGHIDGKGLKSLIDSQTPFILFDARGNKWNDHHIIPGALMASYETSAEEIAEMVPDADSFIVVYCYSSTCPLGDKLLQNLMEFGYTNLVEYPGGLNEWRDILGYPTENIQRPLLRL